MNTHSKNFKDHQIKGISYDENGKKVLYLKEGVVKKRFWEAREWDELESHINYDLINFEKAEKYYKYIEGMEDYERD